VELRTSIVERLAIRVFAEHEAIVTEGVPVPGLLLVGAGRVNLLRDDAEPNADWRRSVRAPCRGAFRRSVACDRAGRAGGALLLIRRSQDNAGIVCDRAFALEIFAGWVRRKDQAAHSSC